MLWAEEMDDERASDPFRTCVGCRRQDARDALLRFVVREEAPRLVPDPERRLPGRGVNVHPSRQCVERAVSRGGFAKVLDEKRPSIDVHALCALASAQYARRVTGLLLAARRSGALVLGTEAVRRALSDGEAALLLFATDAAGRREEILQRSAQMGLAHVSFGTKSELGRLMGREELGVLAILDAGIAEEVAATAARATELTKEKG